jgi:hypothetical protein
MNRLSLILLQFLIIPVCVGLADGFPVSKGFQRLDSFPLDTTSVFTNITDMSSYVSNNPVAYKGQLCTVVNSTNSNLYVISDTGESADWEKLLKAEDIVLIGASARLVALTNGVALEVYNQSTTNWVRQAEWTE